MKQDMLCTICGYFITDYFTHTNICSKCKDHSKYQINHIAIPHLCESCEKSFPVCFGTVKLSGEKYPYLLQPYKDRIIECDCYKKKEASQ